MKLKVLSNYRERSISYAKGEEIEVDEKEGLRLMSDSPGSFQRVGGSRSGAAPEQKATAAETKVQEAPQGSSPRHTELLQLGMNELKALGQSLGINVRVFGLGKEKLIQMILDAEAAGAKAPAGPDQDKMIGAAPEQK